MTDAERQASARARRRARERAPAAGVSPDDSPAVAFLRAVMARTDGLGAGAQAADIRLGLEAADLLARLEDQPSGQRTSHALARILDIPPMGATVDADERRARALEAIRWAMGLLSSGVAGPTDLRAGLAAASRLVARRPMVDMRTVTVGMAMILSGASQGLPPAHLLVGGQDDQDDSLDPAAVR